MLKSSRRSASTTPCQRQRYCSALSNPRSRPRAEERKGPPAKRSRSLVLGGRLADPVDLRPTDGASTNSCRLAVLHRDRLGIYHFDFLLVFETVAFHCLKRSPCRSCKSSSHRTGKCQRLPACRS